MSQPVTGIILAGGRNSRMGGRDKAFLTVDGRSVVERTLDVLQGCCQHVVVVSNRVERYERFNVDAVADELPSVGPLSGLHAGLGRARTDYAFVVACDMPFLRDAPIRFLMDQIAGQDAIVPWWGGDIEPLHAIYRSALRDRIVGWMSHGVASMRDLLQRIRVEYIAEDAMRAVDGAEESFRNVNTPEEAARFRVVLRA